MVGLTQCDISPPGSQTEGHSIYCARKSISIRFFRIVWSFQVAN
jgi:hypothetical protein